MKFGIFGLIAILILSCSCEIKVRWKKEGNTTKTEFKEGEELVCEMYDGYTYAKYQQEGIQIYIFSPRYHGLSKSFCEEGVKVRSNVLGERRCTPKFGWIGGKGELFCSLKRQDKLIDEVYEESSIIRFDNSDLDSIWVLNHSHRTWLQLVVTFSLCIFGLIVPVFLCVWICYKDEGTEEMKQVAIAIRKGSCGFLTIQYVAVFIVAIITAICVMILYFFRPESDSGAKINRYVYGFLVACCFLFGVFCSAASGMISMIMAVITNVRVTAAARRSYGEAVRVALFGGTFVSYLVSTFTILGIVVVFFLVYLVPKDTVNALQTIDLIVGFAFGCSFSALFAQLGGGIFTKAADMGADLVGKTELSLEEDDLRNPAVIADLVGDNVGDCAGRGADLIETVAANVFAVFILGVSLAYKMYPQVAAHRVYDFIMYPLLSLSFGLIACLFGICTIAGLTCLAPKIHRIGEKEEEDQKVEETLKKNENEGEEKDDELEEGGEDELKDDVQKEEEDEKNEIEEDGTTVDENTENKEKEENQKTHSIKRILEIITHPVVLVFFGFCVTFVFGCISTVLINIWCFMGIEYSTSNEEETPDLVWFYFSICGIIGIFVCILISFLTFFYTDYAFYPTRYVAKSAKTGGTANSIIIGISCGMQSTLPNTLVICFGLLSSYWIGMAPGFKDENGVNIGGIYGVAASTLGLLCVSPFILALDVFGPISDNAGGIAEMAREPRYVREITDRLDAVGNTVKALTKGYAMGSAALASSLTIFAFLDSVSNYIMKDFFVIDISVPEVFVGGLLGAVTIFVYVSISLQSVSSVAMMVMKDVKEQFKKNPKIMTYEEKPDYSSCVAKCTKYSLIYMILPGLIGVLAPVLTGFLFRFVGSFQGDDLLGVKCGTAFLVVSTITNVLMGMFLSNSGGSWDNAKKYVELGNYDGKFSETHKASICCDSVGDPFKDTAGPSLGILVTLVATVTLTVGPLWINDI